MNNAQIMLGGFPDRFLLGKKLPTEGSLPTKFVEHLLLRYNLRFAQCHDLLFVAFNQLQRHASACGVSARIKGNHQAVGESN